MAETEQYRVPCVYPCSKVNKVIQVEVPGSKSITNRALLLATLAEGTSVLRGALFSDDSRHFLSCVQELGFAAEAEEEEKIVTVTGLGGKVPKKEASIYVGSAGTAARFLSAYLGVSHGIYHLDASPQMRRRPMAPLLTVLEELGCQVRCEKEEGHFPFTLTSNGFQAAKMTVDIGDSSQFLSALLIASALAEEDVSLRVVGSHGMAYIRMTEKMMEQFGVRAERMPLAGQEAECMPLAGQEAERMPLAGQEAERIPLTGQKAECTACYRIQGGQRYRAREYQIEPDVSAACYFYAMAPLLGISVKVRHVHFDSLQGDVEFLRILERMGCEVREEAEGIRVSGRAGGSFQGIEADMSACSDQAITLAALAPFGDSPTTITGIGHIRLQESDRMLAIVTELKRLGIRCEMGTDFIRIYPGKPTGGLVETYEDHRMAMGFSLIGLRAEGIVIKDPACCRKTFETYFQVLEEVAGQLRQP